MSQSDKTVNELNKLINLRNKNIGRIFFRGMRFHDKLDILIFFVFTQKKKNVSTLFFK